MKIVIATEAYYPLIDGGAVAEHHLALELAKRGHDVHIIAPSLGFYDAVEKDEGTTIHRLASLPIPFVKNDHRLALRPAQKIAKIMDALSPDVVHIHNPFPIGKAVLAYAETHHLPVVATNHWLPENITTFMAKFRFLNAMELLVNWNWKFIINFHNRCDFVTSPTQTAVDLMLNNGLTAPNRPVSNGVELDRFNPAVDPTPFRTRLNLPQKPTILYAGRLSGEKHVDVLINAIPEVLKSVDAHFVIGGNGREKAALIEQAEALGVSMHVTFPGFLEDEEFPQLYTAADIFVMPSICELQSITTLEAMASGLAVVAANKYALPELVRVNENGYLFEPKDHEQLAKHLVHLLKDMTLVKKMGEASRRLVLKHGLDETIMQYVSIYQEIQ